MEGAEAKSAPDTIQADQFVLIRMPSDNVKCLALKAGSTVSLGKFGQFRANDIIGRAWGNTYEIYDRDNKLRIYHPDAFEEIEETDANNREITDDGSSQKLTLEEIHALKAEGLKGSLSSDEIIQKLKESNASFEKKTAYSQAKYVKKKEKKFKKIFTPVKPTLYTLCEHFYLRNPAKIRDMRTDTLAQIMCLGNVHSGGRYLVVDDLQGMLVAAIAERLAGRGVVMGLYDGDAAHYEILKYMNFDQETQSTIKTLSWLRLHRGENEKSPAELQNPAELNEKELEGYNRRLKAFNICEENRRILHEAKFDALIVASQYDPPSILDKLLRYVRGSRPVIVYHAAKEGLLETSTYMKRHPDLLAPQLTESWLRKSQVLPGRTHPEMNTWGSGGALITATKVIDMPVQAALTKREQKAAEKRNAEAKKLKRDRESSETASPAPAKESSETGATVESSAAAAATATATTETPTASSVKRFKPDGDEAEDSTS
ncbi:tRNA (adenine(58)-N(1))-methyltransferase non-catalytic subunit trm6 [Actinomortierella wolfii]|nr:tRNA (adenine(58)-N(1))-methyltransferase non-catalytic subunit trm6 [Actinomortierella wolfii]